MNWWKHIFSRRKMYGELSEEIRAHLEEKVAELIEGGMSKKEAERAARREFGNVALKEEDSRDVWRWRSFENLLMDLRFGLRTLRKSLGFTAVTAITLALGIGANVAIFSVVYAALLRPLPYAEPERLIALGEVRSNGGSVAELAARYWESSYPDYVDWKKQSKAFQALAGFTGDGFVLHGVGEPRLIVAMDATTNFFSTLGVKPLLGRDFVDGEDVPEGPKVAILTYGFWISEFGGDPHVIGRTIQLDDHSVSIIGVLPREVEFAPQGNAQIWVPMHLGVSQATWRYMTWMPVIGRLAPGVNAVQAVAEMKGINARLVAAYPTEIGTVQIIMNPLRERIVGQVQPLLLVLFGAVGFVLLIACANVANLLMVRAGARRKEFAVRAALGASRGRLISQLLIESLMLATAGGAAGLVIARWGTWALIAAIPESLLANTPYFKDAHVNPAVLAFLCAAAILTGLAFGLLPALHVSHTRAVSALKEEVQGGGMRTRLRSALVVAEIAFSLVLLVGAGLMVKSLSALLHRNPGFDTENLLTFSVNLPNNWYPKIEDALRFDGEFNRHMQSQPGVSGIASNSVIPLTGAGNTIRFILEGRPMPPGHEHECNIRTVSNDYFSLMKIPLRAGRFFDDSADGPEKPEHAIVNQSFVAHFLDKENPLGKRFEFARSSKKTYYEIVGVVANIAEANIDSPDEPSLFLPFQQGPYFFISYFVRSPGSAANTVAAVRFALRDVDPQLVMIQPLTMDQIIDQSPSVFLRRYPSYLIGSFAALALLLATVGLYGVIAYSVSQRTRELGIRLALGAHPEAVVRLVLSEGARLGLLGVGIGLLAAIGLTRFLSSLLFGVRAIDPVTFAAAAVSLVLVAAAACYLPARRAMRTDPMVALRYE